MHIYLPPPRTHQIGQILSDESIEIDLDNKNIMDLVAGRMKLSFTGSNEKEWRKWFAEMTDKVMQDGITVGGPALGGDGDTAEDGGAEEGKEAGKEEEVERPKFLKDGTKVIQCMSAMELEDEIRMLEEDDDTFAAETGVRPLWCGNRALANGYCSLIHCQLQGEADLAARKACEKQLKRLQKRMDSHEKAESGDSKSKKDPLLQAAVDQKLEQAKADHEARVNEFDKLAKEAKLKLPEPLPFNTERVTWAVKANFVRRSCRESRVKAREKVMALRPAATMRCENAVELKAMGGLFRETEVRIPRHYFYGHRLGINDVCFSPNGKLIATASEDGTIKIWSARTALLVRTIVGHEGAVRSCHFAKDSRALVSCGVDKTIRIWDTFIGEMIQVMDRWCVLVSFVGGNGVSCK